MISFPKELPCNDCNQYLPVNYFAKRSMSLNGFQPRCLGCASRRIGKWKSNKRKKSLIEIGQLMFDF